MAYPALANTSKVLDPFSLSLSHGCIVEPRKSIAHNATQLYLIKCHINSTSFPADDSRNTKRENSHVVAVIRSAFFGHKQFVLFGGVTIPVGYLDRKRNEKPLRELKWHTIRGWWCTLRISSPFSESGSRCEANGSRCSWSRYFSKLKKVSKKMGVIWQRFRSFRDTLPATDGWIMSSIWMIQIRWKAIDCVKWWKNNNQPDTNNPQRAEFRCLMTPSAAVAPRKSIRVRTLTGNRRHPNPCTCRWRRVVINHFGVDNDSPTWTSIRWQWGAFCPLRRWGTRQTPCNSSAADCSCCWCWCCCRTWSSPVGCCEARRGWRPQRISDRSSWRTELP